jgi:hypothetical protein
MYYIEYLYSSSLTPHGTSIGRWQRIAGDLMDKCQADEFMNHDRIRGHPKYRVKRMR